MSNLADCQRERYVLVGMLPYRDHGTGTVVPTVLTVLR